MGWKAARAGNYESNLRGSFRLGLLTVLTSPFSFAWWMGNGALLIATWGPPGVAGMFAALLAYAFLFTLAFAWLGKNFEHTAVVIAYVSVVMLAGFGVHIALEGFRLLRG